jgi:hypothetical protein
VILSNFLCRIFSCVPSEPERTDDRSTADLGQKEAKNEALSEEQLRHMQGGPEAKSAQRKKASSE